MDYKSTAQELIEKSGGHEILKQSAIALPGSILS